MADAPANGAGAPVEQSTAMQDILTKVKNRKELAEKARKPYVTRWREWYGLHRNYRRWARSQSTAKTEPDRDENMREGQREFGAELFIPYCFATIEAMVPRVLMNNPTMKVKPKKGLKPESSDAIKLMYEERQNEIDYALKLLPVARRGLKYGLGAGKTYWDVQGRNRPILERAMPMKALAAMLTGKPVPTSEFVVSSEGPSIEDLELEDFFWDPVAKNMEQARYIIHRTWRDDEYVEMMLSQGKWDAEGVSLEAVKRMGSDSADRSEMLSERAKASGLEGVDGNLGRLHEIWEYHDGEMVYTILDQKIVVQAKPSPFNHRLLPFQIYRPTLQEGEFVGIGEIEPIVHLQLELNAMRSQRRDNATLILQKAFMYAEGLVDPDDLVVGPGRGIPVYGNPNEALVPLNFGDIPASGYQEEAGIKADIELTTGMSDTIAGGSGQNNASANTATGIQLVQAAANVRVGMKTKLLSQEYIKQQANQWLELWKQKAQEEPLEVAVEGADGYRFVKVTAKELDQVQAILPEDDSTTPDNAPQKKNDALALYNQMRGNDVIDSRKSALHLLREYGVPDAQSWIVPEQTQMNPQIAQVVGQSIRDTLIQANLDPQQAETLALAIMQQVMGAAGVSHPPGGQDQMSQDAAQNGAAPPPQGAPA